MPASLKLSSANSSMFFSHLAARSRPGTASQFAAPQADTSVCYQRPPRPGLLGRARLLRRSSCSSRPEERYTVCSAPSRDHDSCRHLHHCPPHRCPPRLKRPPPLLDPIRRLSCRRAATFSRSGIAERLSRRATIAAAGDASSAFAHRSLSLARCFHRQNNQVNPGQRASKMSVAFRSHL